MAKVCDCRRCAGIGTVLQPVAYTSALALPLRPQVRTGKNDGRDVSESRVFLYSRA